ncbi:MAG: S8 family serine peptidase [Nitrospirae bacterium YQR-1]
METKTRILILKLKNLRPVLLYGQPVYSYYAQIKEVLSEYLGSDLAGLFTEPVISREALRGDVDAMWFSDYIQKAVPLSSLSTERQDEAKLVLYNLTENLNNLSDVLKESERDDLKKLGDLLPHAMEIPGLDYVYVGENGKICLVCWGFKSDEPQRRDFKLFKTLQEAHSESALKLEKTVQQQSAEKTTDDSTAHDKPAFEKESNTGYKETDYAPQPQPSLLPPPPLYQESKIRKYLLWGGLVLMLLLILFLIWWFFLRMPEIKFGMRPADPSKVGIDANDPFKRKIVTNRLTVMLKDGVMPEEFSKKFLKKYPAKNFRFIGKLPDFNLLQAEVLQDEREVWKKRLEESPDVKSVTYDYVTGFKYQPNDPGFKEGQEKSWEFADIKAYEAWDITKGSQGIVIAIIDAGFDLKHTEFHDKITNPIDFITGSNEIPVIRNAKNEPETHGTHVSGIAGALADNGAGVSGICPNCKLMPINIAQSNGLISSVAIKYGIYHAIKKGVSVINISLGSIVDDALKGGTVAQKIETAVKISQTSSYQGEMDIMNYIYKYAAEKGVVIVTAAGNDNMPIKVDTGKQSPDAIVVTASDQSDVKAPFSNFGDLNSISAPGVKIYNSVLDNKYDALSGTSMASPIVAGAVALIKSVNKNLTTAQIREILIKTGKPLSNSADPEYVGPLIQLDAALKEAQQPASNDNCRVETEKLKKEIAELREQLDNCSRQGKVKDDTLIIPKTPTNDFKFAEGHWRASNDIISSITKEPVALRYYFSHTGSGTLNLTEENGTKCAANVSLSFEGNNLLISQSENARCDRGNRFYVPVNVICQSTDNQSAQCEAKNAGDKPFSFSLYREN